MAWKNGEANFWKRKLFVFKLTPRWKLSQVGLYFQNSFLFILFLHSINIFFREGFYFYYCFIGDFLRIPLDSILLEIGWWWIFQIIFRFISHQDKRARSLMILKLFLSIICRFKLISIEGKQWFIGNFSNFSKKIKRTFMRWGCFNIGYVSINGKNFLLIKWQMYDHLKKKWNEF